MAKEAKSITLTLDDKQVTFRVQQLPARKSLKLLHKLARYVSPAMSKFDKGLTGMSIGDAASAIEAVLAGLNEDDVSDIIDRLMDGVSVNGNSLSGVFDVLFQGEVKNVFKLWRFVLEVNYQDFFADLTTAAASLRAAQASPSQTLSSKSGQSGDSLPKVGQA